MNVWLALLLEDHVHRGAAKKWWDADRSDVIGFLRFTQVSVLRLLTTPAAMNGHPRTMSAAWAAYDRLFADDRVALVAEPEGVEACFREYACADRASPKLWADAWLLAFAETAAGAVITFDRALAARSRRGRLLT
ncbi:MAG: TA system VapC family ribonuclease toxin [Acidobacteriota bacterium]